MGKTASALRFGAVALGLIAMLGASPRAGAEEFPNKPIKMVVGVAAGGPTDSLARILAESMSAELGQAVVVENRGGAGGITAYTAVANSAPDGYTIVFVDPAITVHPSLHKNLPYDVEKDLTPITPAMRSPVVLVVRKSLEAANPVELVALAKKNPGKLTYGSAGTGTPPHLNAELFKAAQGIDITHVPYRGSSPAIADLLADRIDVMIVSVGLVKPLIDAGSIKGLAVSGKQRAAKLQDVPTFYDANLPMPALSDSWWGVMAPAKLPADIQKKLHEAVTKALQNPQLLKRIEELNAEPMSSTPAEFAELISRERKKWADTVKNANIQPN